MIREAAVAGSFYPADAATLASEVESLLQSDNKPQPALAVIVPHAGYIYSGSVAGEVLAQVDVPRRVILLGPNHQGYGPNIAVSNAEAWDTPLGPVPLATDLRHLLLEQIPQLALDDSAHKFEHSLEVMLPLLLKRRPDLQIVPISLGRLSLDDCLVLGTRLGQSIQTMSEEVLLLASSDMNHFSSATVTKQLDRLAIDAMVAFDQRRLYEVVRDHRISMCGVTAVVAVMQAARELGADSCRLVRYAHSGQVNGDNSRVVGYAGMIIR